MRYLNRMSSTGGLNKQFQHDILREIIENQQY
jgi:hypothetical protein